MTTLLVILALWVFLSVPLALLVARVMRKSGAGDDQRLESDGRADQRLRDLFAPGRRH
ncbi:transmembrane 9 family protein [Nocardia altamirensis]|uniref:transmembrane 9 family protein n=1 Tax=Nocardia altamirensis TaxID=472158 RepID=UPI00114CA2DA|nr:transmembrane 9 family protein [Nocardia altamirensis]